MSEQTQTTDKLPVQPDENGIVNIKLLQGTVLSPSQVAEMEQSAAGILSGIERINIAGIPLGAAAVGGGVATIVDSLATRFLPGISGPMATLLSAWAVMNWGKKFIGADAAKYAAIFLSYEAIRSTIEGFLSGIPGLSASARASRPMSASSSSIVNQAERVAGNYYDRMFAR